MLTPGAKGVEQKGQGEGGGEGETAEFGERRQAEGRAGQRQAPAGKATHRQSHRAPDDEGAESGHGGIVAHSRGDKDEHRVKGGEGGRPQSQPAAVGKEFQRDPVGRHDCY